MYYACYIIVVLIYFFFIGVCYKSGIGVATDLSKAVKFYKLAADQGNVAALYSLGSDTFSFYCQLLITYITFIC